MEKSRRAQDPTGMQSKGDYLSQKGLWKALKWGKVRAGICQLDKENRSEEGRISVQEEVDSLGRGMEAGDIFLCLVCLK